jgi:hypothetical protein
MEPSQLIIGIIVVALFVYFFTKSKKAKPFVEDTVESQAPYKVEAPVVPTNPIPPEVVAQPHAEVVAVEEKPAVPAIKATKPRKPRAQKAAPAPAPAPAPKATKSSKPRVQKAAPAPAPITAKPAKEKASASKAIEKKSKIRVVK